jgi:hypothetical protein
MLESSSFLVIKPLEIAEDVNYALSESFAIALFSLSISAYRKTRINALLNEVKDFAVLTDNPSNKFLQFAECYLSDNKQDRGQQLIAQKRSIQKFKAGISV